MSYAVTLGCGCRLYVSCHPMTGAAHTRIIEHRATGCPIRSHEVGTRLQAWEVRPQGITTGDPAVPRDHGFAEIRVLRPRPAASQGRE